MKAGPYSPFAGPFRVRVLDFSVGASSATGCCWAAGTPNAVPAQFPLGITRTLRVDLCGWCSIIGGGIRSTMVMPVVAVGGGFLDTARSVPALCVHPTESAHTPARSPDPVLHPQGMKEGSW